MSSPNDIEKRIALVQQYFRKGDAGDAAIINMFADDVELYFPKFGTRTGKAAVGAFAQGLRGQLQSLQHYPDEYTYISSGDAIRG